MSTTLNPAHPEALIAVDLERTVLAQAMEPWGHAAEVFRLPLEAFADSTSRSLYQTLRAVYDRGESLDLINVGEEARRRGRSQADVIDLTSARVSTNVGYHVQALAELWSQREVRLVAMDTMLRAEDPTNDSYEILESAIQRIDRSSPDVLLGNDGGRVRKIGDAFGDLEDRVSRTKAQGGMAGPSSGLRAVDEIVGGWAPSEHIILAAGSGIGKTNLGIKFARSAAMPPEGVEPTGVGYFSVEVPADRVLERMVIAEGRIDSGRMKRGRLLQADKEAFRAARDRIKAAPIWVDDARGMPVLNLVARARRLVRDEGVGLIVVDYLQRLAADGLDARNYERAISAISATLAGLAQTLNVPVISLSQLTRDMANSGDKPTMHDLRGSGDIENDADRVVLLHRPEAHGVQYDKEAQASAIGLARIIMGKGRNGGVGEALCTYSEKYLDFWDGLPKPHEKHLLKPESFGDQGELEDPGDAPF